MAVLCVSQDSRMVEQKLQRVWMALSSSETQRRVSECILAVHIDVSDA